MVLNLVMLNRQMVLIGQLKLMARLKAPTEDIIDLLRRLQAQNALMRMGLGDSPLDQLEPTGRTLLNMATDEGAMTEAFYQRIISFSVQAQEQLELELLQAPGNPPEVLKLLMETRADVKELMDWVVLLAGGKPNS